MFSFLAVLTSFSAITMLVAGSLSLLRDPSRREYRWFFILTAALFVWVPANFIDSNVVRAIFTPVAVKIDYSFALIMGWVLLQFAYSYTVTATVRSKRIHYFLADTPSFRWGTAVANAFMIAAIALGQVYEISLSGGSLQISSTSLGIIYNVLLLGYFVGALAILGQAYFRSTSTKREGLNIIWIGLFIAIVANIATNIVFPSVIHERSVVKELNIIGYAGILMLVGAVYFAITSKKFFDIKLVVARSLAYALLVTFVGAIYIGLITLTSFLFISGTKLSPLFVVSNLLLTLFAALTFQYVRNFFNRLTSQIFFRDSYDPQAVINDVNGIATSTLDLNTLLHQSSDVLARAMKSSYCTFVIGNDQHYRLLGTQSSPRELLQHATSISKIIKPHMPIVVEDIEGVGPWKKDISHVQTELLVPLYTNQSLIGFLAFGTKQNGVVYAGQDINLLMTVADGLAVAIQNALRFEEIQNFNITLQERIEQATHKLRNANRRLTELDETKDDFISMASHQLRTPLTSVKGYLSLVLEGDAGKISPMQRKLLGQAFTSSQRMVYLIADLLNVSRLKTGKFVIEAAPSNLAEVVQEEIAQLKETLNSHSLTLVYNKPAHFPELMLDVTKTRQVIMNFIDNAIYYTPAGGRITVDVVDKPSAIELTVKDTGIGVPKVEQHHLFTKFYRANNARKARPDGTGLGLFMAKKVIVAQGGAVIFDSTEGKGSTFGFTLSKSKLGVPAHADNTHKKDLTKGLAKV